jgi:hypothetical protein
MSMEQQRKCQPTVADPAVVFHSSVTNNLYGLIVANVRAGEPDRNATGLTMRVTNIDGVR